MCIRDRVIGNNTDGDKTKINYVDRFYDLIIMWDNPVNYYVGFTEQFEILENYYINEGSVHFSCNLTIILAFRSSCDEPWTGLRLSLIHI